MLSVLVADDNELVRRLLQEALNKEGYEVETVESEVMVMEGF